jgi:hypothetical protein
MKHYELEEFHDQIHKPGKIERLKSILRGESKPDEPIAPEPPRKTRTIAELALEQAKKKLAAEKEKERALSQDQNRTTIEPPRPTVPIQTQTVPIPRASNPIPDDALYEESPTYILQPKTVASAPMPEPKKKGLVRLTGIFKRKPKVPKQVVPQEVKQHARYRLVDSGILLFAFLAGTVSIILVYHELPTHPYLIIGIAGIAVSVGIITGINRW